MNRAKILDLLERVGLTYAQAFVAAIVLTGPLDLGTVQAAALAGVAAVLNLAYRLLTALKPHTGSALGDLAERLVVTFASTAIAALITQQHYGLTDIRAAALGGLAAAIAVAKAGVAGLITSTPSLVAPLNPIGSGARKTLTVGSATVDVATLADVIAQAIEKQASTAPTVPAQPEAPPGT